MGRASKDVVLLKQGMEEGAEIWQMGFENATEFDFELINHAKQSMNTKMNTVGDMLNQCVAHSLTRFRNVANATLQATGPLIHWFPIPGQYGHMNVGASQKVLILACGAKIKCYNLSSLPNWIGKGPWPESYDVLLAPEIATKIKMHQTRTSQISHSLLAKRNPASSGNVASCKPKDVSSDKTNSGNVATPDEKLSQEALHEKYPNYAMKPPWID